MPYKFYCSICLCELLPEKASVLRCGHTFHYNCIVRWLQTSQTCAVCRGPSTEESLVKQVHFSSDDVEQCLEPRQLSIERELRYFAKKMTQLEQEAFEKEEAHRWIKEDLRRAELRSIQYRDMFTQEKATSEKLASELAQLRQVERQLREDQQTKLEALEARLKNFELLEEAMKMEREHFERSMKLLHETCSALEICRKTTDLRVSVARERKQCTALREEISNLRRQSSQPVNNGSPKRDEVSVPRLTISALLSRNPVGDIRKWIDGTNRHLVNSLRVEAQN